MSETNEGRYNDPSIKKEAEAFEIRSSDDIAEQIIGEDHVETGETIEDFPYAAEVARLFEIGDSTEDLYAWHGTSIEAILYLAKHGKLPATGKESDYFYYVPEGIGSEEGDREHAERYGTWNSQTYYIASRLPFEVNDFDLLSGVFIMEEDREKFLEEEAYPHNVSFDDLLELYKDAMDNRSGVLLTLSNKLKEDFEGELTPGAHDEMRIHVPELSIEYISGIEPLGQYEYDVLENLQRLTDKN